MLSSSTTGWRKGFRLAQKYFWSYFSKEEEILPPVIYKRFTDCITYHHWFTFLLLITKSPLIRVRRWYWVTQRWFSAYNNMHKCINSFFVTKNATIIVRGKTMLLLYACSILGVLPQRCGGSRVILREIRQACVEMPKYLLSVHLSSVQQCALQLFIYTH